MSRTKTQFHVETTGVAKQIPEKARGKVSANELELLAIVRALEHFKYYLYGNKFTLQTDHQS